MTIKECYEKVNKYPFEVFNEAGETWIVSKKDGLFLLKPKISQSRKLNVHPDSDGWTLSKTIKQIAKEYFLKYYKFPIVINTDTNETIEIQGHVGKYFSGIDRRKKLVYIQEHKTCFELYETSSENPDNYPKPTANVKTEISHCTCELGHHGVHELNCSYKTGAAEEKLVESFYK